MKYGVILARFQPIHNGHLALIKKACSENTKVLLLVGSDGYEVITIWFPKFILRDYISMTLMARTQVEDGVSATSVREAIVTNKDLSNLVPQCVIDVRSFLKEFITLPIKYEHSSN